MTVSSFLSHSSVLPSWIASKIAATAGPEAPATRIDGVPDASFYGPILLTVVLLSMACLIAVATAFALHRMLPRSDMMVRLIVAAICPFLAFLLLFFGVGMGIDGRTFGAVLNNFLEMPLQGKILVSVIVIAGFLVSLLTTRLIRRREIASSRANLEAFE